MPWGRRARSPDPGRAPWHAPPRNSEVVARPQAALRSALSARPPRPCSAPASLRAGGRELEARAGIAWLGVDPVRGWPSRSWLVPSIRRPGCASWSAITSLGRAHRPPLARVGAGRGRRSWWIRSSSGLSGCWTATRGVAVEHVARGRGMSRRPVPSAPVGALASPDRPLHGAGGLSRPGRAGDSGWSAARGPLAAVLRGGSPGRPSGKTQQPACSEPRPSGPGLMPRRSHDVRVSRSSRTRSAIR